jgi:hypothetical protein
MLKAAFFVLSCLIFSGCASYPFGAGARSLPGGYDKISVPIFKNLTAEPGIEPFFTASLIEEMNRGHKAKVTDRTDAQVIMEGEIASVRYDQGPMVSNDHSGPAPFAQTKDASGKITGGLPDSTVIVTSYRITVTVNLILRRISDSSILWSGDFKGEQQYSAPQITNEVTNASNPLYNQSARQLTLKVISRAMMTEAYDRLTENF